MQKLSKKGLPYIPAKLKNHINEGKKRYYIKFSVWDADLQKLQPVKRSYMLNDESIPFEVRMHHAASLVKQLNTELYEGKKLIKSKNKKNQSFLSITDIFLETIAIIENTKGLSTDSTLRNYKFYINNFIEWLKLESLEYINPNLFKREQFQRFLDYLKIEKGYANKTYNHHLATVITIKNEIKKRNSKLWKDDPFDGFDKLKVKTSKHAVFSDEQMKKFKLYCDEKNEAQFLLFIYFAYYTLARPKKELRFLKVGDIELDHDRMLVIIDSSKGDERYCPIPARLKEIIIESGILNYSPDYYVFSIKGVPDSVPTGRDYFYEKNVKMLSFFGLNNGRHTLYSFKHSGALAFYLATKDIKALQYKMGHTSVSQTDHYLRALGVSLANKDANSAVLAI